MLKQGSGKDSFLQELEDLAGITGRYFVGDTKNLQVKMGLTRSGNVGKWEIESKGKVKQTDQRSGKFLKSFFDRINEMYQSQTILCAHTMILILYSVDTVANAKGLIKTTWYLLCPGAPYTLQDGQPVFDLYDVYLTEQDAAFCMNTRLAFLGANNELYVATENSAKALGSIFQVTQMFEKDTDPLALGIFLSSAMLNLKNIQFITRERHNGSDTEVYQIVNTVGSRYHYISQIDFFKNIMSRLVTEGITRLTDWTITDQKSSCTIEFLTTDDYELGIHASCGEGFGVPMEIEAYASFGEDYMVLKRNTAAHKSRYEEDGMDRLMNGIVESLEQFRNSYNEKINICFDVTSYMKEVHYVKRLVGLKRFKKLFTVGEEGIPFVSLEETLFHKKESVSFRELYLEIMSRINRSDIGDKQHDLLRKLYAERFFAEREVENLEMEK